MKRATLTALALLLAAGCSKVETPDSSASASASPSAGESRHTYTLPHTLRYATAEEITGLNPMFASQAVVAYMSSMTMAYLIKTDAKGLATVPELATEVPSQANHDISADGKSITWHLRKGVVWSDGKPFDGDDVVFSVAQILNTKNNVISREGWDLISKVDEPDKYTVIFHLTKPYSSFAYTYFSSAGANPAILPKHLLAGATEINDSPYNALPVGIGPFKYESWKRADAVTMVANPSYWRGTPKLERIIQKIIPDRDTVAQELRTHEIDLWTPVAPHYVPRLKDIDGVTVSMIPDFTFDHLDFNMQRPALQDPAVRKALRYGVDRALLNQKIRFGLYILTESPISPASAFYDPSIALIPFDIAKGNALLDAAGWKRGADGIRTKNGLRLSFDWATGVGNPDVDTQIELIRGWWKQMGVDLTVKHYSSGLYFAQAQAGGILYGGKFDVTAFGWGGDPHGDLSNLYACNRFPPDGQNIPRYCDQAVSAAMERAKATYDETARAKDLDFIQKKMVEDVPIVVLDARKYITAYNSDLQNWHPNAVAPFDDMMNVDI